MTQIIHLGGEKIQTVELFTGPWSPPVIERRPWYEGRSKRFGKYCKRYANGRQKLKRKNKRKRISLKPRWGW